MRGGFVKSSSQSSVTIVSLCEFPVVCPPVDFFIAEMPLKKHLRVFARLRADSFVPKFVVRGFDLDRFPTPYAASIYHYRLHVVLLSRYISTYKYSTQDNTPYPLESG